MIRLIYYIEKHSVCIHMAIIISIAQNTLVNVVVGWLVGWLFFSGYLTV